MMRRRVMSSSVLTNRFDSLFDGCIVLPDSFSIFLGCLGMGTGMRVSLECLFSILFTLR
jgi:hypothetical protein